MSDFFAQICAIRLLPHYAHNNSKLSNRKHEKLLTFLQTAADGSHSSDPGVGCGAGGFKTRLPHCRNCRTAAALPRKHPALNLTVWCLYPSTYIYNPPLSPFPRF